MAIVGGSASINSPDSNTAKFHVVIPGNGYSNEKQKHVVESISGLTLLRLKH
jgi:hypothetical protein